MKVNTIKTFVTLLFLFAITAPLSGAVADTSDSNCQPIYGGGQTCKPSEKIIIDKKIIHPVSHAAVDNLGVNDPKFKAEQEVRFSIAVRNTGTTDVTELKLADTMAEFVQFTSGSVTFTEENGEYIYTIDSLKAGETRVYEIKTKVRVDSELPSDKGIICTVNRAAVAFKDQLAEDTASFCIQKDVVVITPTPIQPGQTTQPGQPKGGVMPPTTKGGQPIQPGTTTKGGQPVFPSPQSKTVPQTGPELLALIGLLPTAGAGLFLRKKAK